jgi:hypothetical protein
MESYNIVIYAMFLTAANRLATPEIIRMKASSIDSNDAHQRPAGPDWRWQRAVRLACTEPPVRPQGEDELVQQAIRFLRLRAQRRSGPAVASCRYPTIAAALELWTPPSTRVPLTILTISGMPREDIARQLDVLPDVVGATEDLFFDVRPALSAPGWIHARVIAALMNEGDADVAAKVKTAYHGGPVVAKALVDGSIRVPKDAAERLHAQELLLHAKFTAAVEYPLNEKQNLEYLELCMEYMLKKEELDQAKRVFTQRCQEELRRHQLRKQRLALQAARYGITLAPEAGPGEVATSRPVNAGLETVKFASRNAG